MRTNTLGELLRLSAVTQKDSRLVAVPEDSRDPVVVLPCGSSVNHWTTMGLGLRALTQQYMLCFKRLDGTMYPAATVWGTFDRETAPLTANLLVYSNGDIIWDNVRTIWDNESQAQGAKGST